MRFEDMLPDLWKGINPVWLYEVEIVRVYDGDTFTGNIDQGFYDKKVDQTFRVTNMNSKWDTPELRGSSPAEKVHAERARSFMSDLLGTRCVIYSHNGTGMYGRWLVTPFHYETGVNICDLMNDEGLSRNYTGSKRPPWSYEDEE